MDRAVVLARAVRGRPVMMVAVGQRAGTVYLSAPARVDEVRRGDAPAIGFPQEDVFKFDPILARRLVAQWEERGVMDAALWQEAQPYG